MSFYHMVKATLTCGMGILLTCLGAVRLQTDNNLATTLLVIGVIIVGESLFQAHRAGVESVK